MSVKTIALLSRLSLHGDFLRKLLSRHYNVVWVGRTFPFRISSLNVVCILWLEFWELLFEYRRTRFSLILVQYVSLDSLLAILFKRLLGVKVALFAVGSDLLKMSEHTFAYPLVRKAVLSSDLVFCVSSSIEKTLLAIGADASVVKVVPSAIDVDDFQHYDGPKTYDVITIGTLNSNKNQKLLIDACKLLPRSIKVLVIGDGRMLEPLEAESKRYGLNIVFARQIPHKQVLLELQRSKVYVHTSLSEGLPVAVLEAILAELPVVLVDSQYVADIEGVYGFTVHVSEKGSIDNLATKIVQVLEDYEIECQTALVNKEKLIELAHRLPIEIRVKLEDAEKNVWNLHNFFR